MSKTLKDELQESVDCLENGMRESEDKLDTFHAIVLINQTLIMKALITLLEGNDRA